MYVWSFRLSITTTTMQYYVSLHISTHVCLYWQLESPDSVSLIYTCSPIIHGVCVCVCVCIQNVNGAFAEYILELVSISVNKNTVPGEYEALNPSGLRIGETCGGRD